MERQLGKKLKTSQTFSGTFPSPESPPEDSEDGRAHVKGWYSERIPHSSYKSRKGYVTTAALMPFSSGRALPSKWEDAERWITSPVNVGNVSNNGNYFYGPGVHKSTHFAQYNSQRRVKSKSGPLGPSGVGSYGSYNNTFSPVLGVSVINGMKWSNSLAVETPVDVEVRGEEFDGDSGGDGEDGRRRSCPGHDEPEWLDWWSGPLHPNDKRVDDSADGGLENIDDINNDGWKDESKVERVITRRDMATQMYPESETSSPYANSPSPLPSNNETNLDVQTQDYQVRDVQIDRQSSKTTVRPIPNKQIEALLNCTIVNHHDYKMFKLRTEEARINAWENLQKVKAESAIQKLEMKLEKKRETSMEKIIKKLRRAEIKAQTMRDSLGDHVQNRHGFIQKQLKKFLHFVENLV